MKIYSYSMQGKRLSNEDTHIIYENISNNYLNNLPINIIGVFDGHGGKLVSQYLKKHYIDNLKANISLRDLHNSRQVILKITQLYNILQDKLIQEHPRAIQNCGSTSCVLLHYLNSTNKHRLWVLNVGDSRAIKCNSAGIAEQLSNDHKPNNPTEKARIESLGGVIKFDGVDWRVEDLSLSRAFGDLSSTPYVTHLPEIYRYKIDKHDKFIIIACDGLWDVLSNQEAIDFVLQLKNIIYKNNYAQALAEYAYNKGSTDNITVIVYFL